VDDLGEEPEVTYLDGRLDAVRGLCCGTSLMHQVEATMTISEQQD
jgi:hypothetical protein